MKNNIMLMALMFLGAHFLFAQDGADKLEIGVGGTFAKPKIIPGMTKLAVTQILVNYKMTTTMRTTTREKSSGTIAGAKITASMETTDGELTPADFQQVTDNFYKYFQKKLKENGIDTVAWNTIAATDFYQNGAEKGKDKSGEAGDNNIYFTSIANKGNLLYAGGIAFTFGKAKKATKFSEEVAAPAGYFNLTVDFADILVGVDIKTSESSSMYTITKTKKFKYDASVAANVNVIQTPGKGFSLFWNEKNQSETLFLKSDLTGVSGYSDQISQDPSRMKNNPFRFAKEMTPVVIETTKEKYKAAAAKALEQFADAFVAKTKAKK